MRPTLLVLVALCIVKYNKAQLCLANQLPSFSSGNGENHNNFNGREFILSPSLTFNCTGRVTRWQAYMEREGTYNIILFLVLRPSLWPCSYEVVGRHSLNNFIVDGNLLVDTPVESSLEVQPGDVIGVYSDYRNRRTTFKLYRNYDGLSYRVNSVDAANADFISCNSTMQTNTVPFVNAVTEVISQPSPVTTPLIMTTPPTFTTPSMLTTHQPVTTPPPPMTTSAATTSTTAPFFQTASTIARTMPAQQPTATSVSTEDISSDLPDNATNRQELTRVGSDESNQNQAQDQATSGTLYIVIGTLATGVALFVMLSLICGVVFCVFVHRRRSSKAMMRFTIPQNSRSGRGKYYEGGHVELELPSRFEYNEDHIYDTVNQFQAAPPSKKGKNGKKSQYLDTSMNNPNMLTTPVSSMEFSKRTTLGDRSKVGRNAYKGPQPFKQTTKSNDYEEHPSLPAASVPQVMCSEYEVPISSSQELQQSPRKAVGDEYCTPLRPKSNSKKGATGEMRQPASFNLLSTENCYELPYNSVNLTESQTAQTKATPSDSYYEIPCTPQVSQQADTTRKNKEDDDEDYMCMDGTNS